MFRQLPTISNFNTVKKLFIALFALVSGVSCTEEIDLDLNVSDPQIVAEGIVAEGAFATVGLTLSVNFDESNSFPTVGGASVVITDDQGTTEHLTEIQPGLYMADTLRGQTGRRYTLSILSGDKSLHSNSVMPEPVAFDSLFLRKTSGGGGPGGGGGNAYEVWVQYSDPADEKNYYRFVEYLNGWPTASIFVFDDRLTNGNHVEHRLMSMDRKLKPGDVLVVEMQCIDAAVYDYFSSFGNLGGGPQAASTPANPYTNIQGSRLGYFSAHTVQRRSMVVQ